MLTDGGQLSSEVARIFTLVDNTKGINCNADYGLKSLVGCGSLEFEFPLDFFRLEGFDDFKFFSGRFNAMIKKWATLTIDRTPIARLPAASKWLRKLKGGEDPFTPLIGSVSHWFFAPCSPEHFVCSW
jgi:hypothetical protein